MEIDIPGESNGSPVVMENQCQLYPVSVSDSGEGLPYAPIDWPNPGDTWSWKVGKRINVNGYFQDRYIYPPIRFQKQGKRRFLKSKPSVERYVWETFPGVGVDAFFASFSWKIPAKKLSGIEGPSGSEEGTRVRIQYRRGKLFAQKNYLLYLYQQLNEERSGLFTCTLSNDQDASLDAVLNWVDQIKREIVKLREM
ncbi:uncharacterized protein LOC130760988 isoform X2 [Actinidia eriantha]|uniref:uncharacterized protein LOC130760988 isoform X2 n=1 Tax=Actinidia eriantha TaxID=165200 RepID=UPI00258C2640|nr:uncharacterized protein LOC130760988 isoform X2 [Actinidia eriantha]